MEGRVFKRGSIENRGGRILGPIGWALVLASSLGLWEGLAYVFPNRIPSIEATITFLISTPPWILGRHVLITFKNTVYGFLIALALALLLAYLSTESRLIRAIVSAINGLVQSISVLVWSIVLTMVFGVLSPLPPILVVVAASFPILLSAVMGGLVSVDRKMMELIGMLGGGKKEVFRDVVLPSSLPHIASGSRSALGLALRISVVAEAFGQGGGIGYMINLYYGLAEPKGVFGWALLLIALMLLLDRLALSRMERAAERWKG